MSRGYWFFYKYFLLFNFKIYILCVKTVLLGIFISFYCLLPGFFLLVVCNIFYFVDLLYYHCVIYINHLSIKEDLAPCTFDLSIIIFPKMVLVIVLFVLRIILPLFMLKDSVFLDYLNFFHLWLFLA